MERKDRIQIQNMEKIDLLGALDMKIGKLGFRPEEIQVKGIGGIDLSQG